MREEVWRRGEEPWEQLLPKTKREKGQGTRENGAALRRLNLLECQRESSQIHVVADARHAVAAADKPDPGEVDMQRGRTTHSRHREIGEAIAEPPVGGGLPLAIAARARDAQENRARRQEQF